MITAKSAATAALEKKRLFAAVYPTREVVEELAAAARLVAREFSPRAIHWTPPDQIHITLNFLGFVETSRIPELENAILSACAQSIAHRLRAGGLGCFPNAQRPAIIWAGLTGAVDSLLKLKRLLDEALKETGYVPEKRPFHPHLTIGRVNELNSRERQSLRQAISGFGRTGFGDWTAQKVDFVESVLSPQGSTYSVLKSFPLIAA